MSDRDLFANFERMRREVDELFGDVLERTGLTRRRSGFCPAVDVVYTGEPPRAIVTAELAGVAAEDLDLEIQGSTLVLSGRRGAGPEQEGVYQQIEIERGSFRRTIELAAEVDATGSRAHYEDGILRIELPLRGSAESRARPIPVQSSGD